MKYSVFQICNAIDYPIWIHKTNYCQRQELELVCELMKWPFRELILCIQQVLHVFSQSGVQLLVASVINPECWGNLWALMGSILPWQPLLPTPSLQLCSGAGALCHLGGGTRGSHCWRCADLQSCLLDGHWTGMIAFFPVLSPVLCESWAWLSILACLGILMNQAPFFVHPVSLLQDWLRAVPFSGITIGFQLILPFSCCSL